jgi:cobalt-zinc-cadmium efflux system protein
LLIAGYALWQAFAQIGASVRVLMLRTPPDLDVNALVAALRGVEGVQSLHMFMRGRSTRTTMRWRRMS